FVAQHHAPESPPLPQAELEQAGLLRRGVFAFPARPLAEAPRREVAVDRRYHIAFLRQHRADELTALGVGANALLGTAVPVQADDGGDRPLTDLGDQENAGN